ncbi:hypothetical protein RJD24_07485 [Bacillaceae bacterium IKA-2]|nr:hypothetical protein RJD24_07485 [Bacillaceae bacterium IKA-2]
MKHLALISFIFIIGSIVVTSFFFMGNDAVKDYTKEFIAEIITTQQSSALTEVENDKIKEFFHGFQELGLPHPIIYNVEIPYFDEYTNPTVNGNFAQYISVQYDPVANQFDTHVYFEYISYTADGSMGEIFFGQIDVRSYDENFSEIEIISILPVEKQK